MPKRRKEEDDNEELIPKEFLTPPEEVTAHFAQTPAREVDMPSFEASDEDGKGIPKGVTESIESTADMTDMQYIASLLSPKLGTDIQRAAMVSRVDPNVYLARLHLNSIDEIMHCDPEKSIDVNAIWQKNEILLSIGLDGMHIIDLLELAGAAREEKRLEKQFGSLGAG